MNEKLSVAVEVLLEKLEEQEKTVIETKKMINSLLHMSGEKPRFIEEELKQTNNVLRPDQFYGKPLATAIRSYLELGGKTARSLDEIFNALRDGGFDFTVNEWKEKDWLRNLSISISKNKVFHRITTNGYIGLLEWYPEVKKIKKVSISTALLEKLESVNETNTEENNE